MEFKLLTMVEISLYHRRFKHSVICLFIVNMCWRCKV